MRPDRYSSIVIEAAGGRVLETTAVDELRHPASLAKLMTLYMVFEALRDRRIGLTTPVSMSAYAASMPRTKLDVPAGGRLTVEEGILGLVTKSANDAAAAFAEMLGGDEGRFAQMMTLRARALGMSRTTFRNASGLPDDEQWTTARDMAVLARRIITDFPSYYIYFSTPSFVFHGRVIPSHDRLLQSYPGADGMKTGWIISSGFNLVTSALRSGVRLIGVVLGAETSAERDQQMTGLLDAGFERMDVPVNARPATTFASRLPSLFPQAQAAPLYAGTPGRGATSRQLSPAPRAVVQVGTYGDERSARAAALSALRALGDGQPQIEQSGTRGRMIWRAQIGGLTPAQAQSACPVLARKRLPCFASRAEAGQVASR